MTHGKLHQNSIYLIFSTKITQIQRKNVKNCVLDVKYWAKTADFFFHEKLKISEFMFIIQTLILTVNFMCMLNKKQKYRKTNVNALHLNS